MTDEDDKDPPDSAGPTAKAVLANPSLDPELAEKLSRWFGSEPEPSSQESESTATGENYMARVDALLAEAADAELVARVGGERMMEVLRSPLRPRTAERTSTFEPRLGVRLRVPELYTREPPHDIEDIVYEDNTPQALLRDLHRLEWEFDLYIETEILSTHMPWESPQKLAVEEALRRLQRPTQVREVQVAAFAAVDSVRDVVRVPCSFGKPVPPSDEKDSAR